ncbi:MAG: hypothetical protein ACE5NN_02125 [Candidatus Bathyarchaeia archaeon]
MEPLSLIYWIKMGLGILSAVLCILLPANNIFSSIGIGILTYIVSDKILRRLFIDKVDEPSAVTKTGIGIYIITWVFFWVLLFSLINPPPPPAL